MEKTHIRKEKKKPLILLAIAAAVLAAVLIALAVHEITRVHYAADFGFDDIKSSIDADGDGIDDHTDIMRWLTSRPTRYTAVNITAADIRTTDTGSAPT